jgi:capsular polysaccharide transport system permease protein
MFQTSLRTLLPNWALSGTLQRSTNPQMGGHFERIIRVWLSVINALLLRDIRVRAGKFYVGYLVIFSMPFAHLAVMLIIFAVIFKRSPPFGNQPLIFFGVSMLPFVIFVYPARQVMMSLIQNRPLLYFPRVKIIDVFIARGILEFANGMAVAGVVCIVLFMAEGEFSPRDPFGFFSALALTLYLGFAWGAYNALFALIYPFWAMAFNLCFPLLWLSCGALYYVHGLPSEYAYLLSFNPLLQCVEWLRYAYYEGYPGNLVDPWYAFWVATGLLAGTFVWEWILRRKLLGG